MLLGVHVTLESLMNDKELISSIKGLVRGSGRSQPSVEETEETIVMITGKHQPAKGQEKISFEKQLTGVPRPETYVL